MSGGGRIEPERRVTKELEEALSRIRSELRSYLGLDIQHLQGRLVQLLVSGTLDESRVKFIDSQLRGKECLTLLKEARQSASKLQPNLGSVGGNLSDLLVRLEKQLDSQDLFLLVRRVRQGVMRFEKARDEIVLFNILATSYCLLIKVALAEALGRMGSGERAESSRIAEISGNLMDRLRVLLSSWEGYLKGPASDFNPPENIRGDWESSYVIYGSAFSLVKLVKPNPMNVPMEFAQYMAKKGRYWDELTSALDRELDRWVREGKEIFALEDFSPRFLERFTNIQASLEDVKFVIGKLKGRRFWGFDQSPELGEVVVSFDLTQAQEELHARLRGRELNYVDELKKELGWGDEKLRYVLRMMEGQGKAKSYVVGQETVYVAQP